MKIRSGTNQTETNSMMIWCTMDKKTIWTIFMYSADQCRPTSMCVRQQHFICRGLAEFIENSEVKHTTYSHTARSSIVKMKFDNNKKKTSLHWINLKVFIENRINNKLCKFKNEKKKKWFFQFHPVQTKCNRPRSQSWPILAPESVIMMKWWQDRTSIVRKWINYELNCHFTSIMCNRAPHWSQRMHSEIHQHTFTRDTVVF